MGKNNQDKALISHLMSRAGFGCSQDKLEKLSLSKYEKLVDDLLNPKRFEEVEEDLIHRYYGWDIFHAPPARWIYRMLNTERPLQEKMALFWHYIFATAFFKSEHVTSLNRQLEMFQKFGMDNLKTILLELSRDPAMIYWLDNNENINGEPNENYGRELLELFSMGVGNYTESDVKMAARAFTGWTFDQPLPLYPHGLYDATFKYKPDEHDRGIKTFLGETGNFDGDDIIDIIVKQPATATFISRHLYNFFVSDEPQVAAWQIEPPQDPEAIRTLVSAYMTSNGDIKSVLNELFNSDFFKKSQVKKVKSPVELVTGIINLTGTHKTPSPGMGPYQDAIKAMGQELLNPPTVEGWHTGKEWIDGGTLNERINFAVNQVSDAHKPGIEDIIDRIFSKKHSLEPREFMNVCLELVGHIKVGNTTRSALIEFAESGGKLVFNNNKNRAISKNRIIRMIQLIVSSTEYQFG